MTLATVIGKSRGRKLRRVSSRMALASPIPVIDPRVRHVGVSKLRELNASELKKQSERRETLVIQVDDMPVAVIVAYDTYISIQQMILSAQPGTKTMKIR